MRIAVLLSGGIDSAIAAWQLKEQGHEIKALTMINWDTSIAEKAAYVAGFLEIPHEIIDIRPVFQRQVVQYFINEYARGRTPNPCVECNKHIKFGVLLDRALSQGYERIATGHYARIEYCPEKKRYLLRQGVDFSKDQSYFLYGLTQAQLSKIIFPLGNQKKEDIAARARELGLKTAQDPESQEICFVPGDYRIFLQEHLEAQKGDMVDTTKEIVGQHKGLYQYTIGQRRGLGISRSTPVYVIAIDPVSNRLLIGEEKDLYRRELECEDNNIILHEEVPSTLEVMAKIRYQAPGAAATIFSGQEKINVRFDQPQRAVTPGQSVVFYRGDYVVGGGIIC